MTACPLTRGQLQIVELAAAGNTIHQIGHSLGVSAKAIDGSYARIRKAIGARNNVEMVAAAIVAGWIEPKRIDCLRRQRAFAASPGRRKAA